MTALPLSASAGAPCDCESSAAPIAPPATLPTDVRAYVTSQPDALLVAWLQLSPQALDVLTERERAHALGLLAQPALYDADYRTAQCAAYVRERLVSGDHVKAAARAALEPGAVLTLGGRLYTVTGRRGRLVAMTGERGGKADLYPPVIDGGRWALYRGGLGRPNAKTEMYRRDDRDGTFTAAP